MKKGSFALMPYYGLKSYSYKGSLVDLFEAFKDDNLPFFLHSGLKSNELGRFSFLGGSPFLVFKSKGRNLQIQQNGSLKKKIGNPLAAIKELLNQYRLNESIDAIPFLGGAVGYFAYDLGFILEKIPLRSQDDLNLPDCILGFYDPVIIYDHKMEKLHIFSSGLPEKNTSLAKKLAQYKLKLIEEKLNRWESGVFKNGASGWQARLIEPSGYASNFSHESYLKAIVKAKDYIKKGDIYQLNLSQRFSLNNPGEPFSLYKNLVRINPSPFSAYFDAADFQIISSSPERFLNLNSGVVETRPMKGTRPRGRDAREDSALRKELLESAKDKAELIMIADLERNDLGKVCSYGSIKVKKLRNLESYATVFQTTSSITGHLHPDKDAIDLLKACFPGGSITGCPKIRAMQIIEELEPTRRSVYTGAVGYIGFNGNMDLNIAIRTIIKKHDEVYFQVGGGIVADSVPELEYEETLVKARALFKALSFVNEPVGVF
ncbi:MAG: aminodeoxychorismate synthase component I [Candidatus Omnitrophota bacterium]